ncbi:RICIN domain-containing protein [Kribbella sp. NPDC056345]|uniref:RICIN domain-containing protein n=1 Tax=Kribbella sp. NPDC056345 TaxID=3345789 RepID=UPI0035E37C20
MGLKTWSALVLGVVALLGATTPPAHAGDSYPLPITNNWNGRCLDANANYLNQNGTPVQLWDCNGWDNQQWIMRSVSYYSEFQIVNKSNGRCLDANASWGGRNGTPVQLWDCYGPGQHNQIWFVYRESGENHNYTIKNKASGRVLDANLSYIGSNGTPIQLWDNLGAQQYNQRWRVF